MRWVVLLLLVAVILPTVCLLWFMGQAVKNERLAVRQKLIDVYTKRAQSFFNKVPDLIANPAIYVHLSVEVCFICCKGRRVIKTLVHAFHCSGKIGAGFPGMVAHGHHPVKQSVRNFTDKLGALL